MPSVTQVVENDLTRLLIVPLPYKSRTRTSYPIVKDGAAVSGTYTDIAVDATTTKLYRGSRITFPGGITLIASADVAVGATSIPIESKLFALADDEAGTTFAEAEIYGADNASISTSTGEVDISGYGDGVESEMLTVSIGREMAVSGIFTSTGAMYDVMRPLGVTGEQAKREAYFTLLLGDGSGYQGVCRVTNYGETVAFRDVLKFTATLKGQGKWTLIAPTA
jgi:hypothetical protein